MRAWPAAFSGGSESRAALRAAAKRTSALIALAGLLVAGPVVAGLLLRSPPPPESGVEAVREVLLRQQAAWNDGDLEAFMAGYWHSPELTFFSGGTEQHGWDATMARYRLKYQAGDRQMGRLTFSDLRIQLLGPDSAFVRGRWRLVIGEETLGGLFTLVFRKFPEGWRIVHDHTSAEEKAAHGG
jgi:ketosteroid isomerase-like protein